MNGKAYSVFEIKSADEAQGIITGIASTPEADRIGDIVEPHGAVFKLPIPLLWQHDSKSPLGHVLRASVTDKGIEIVAKVALGVTDEIDRAFKLIRAGVVRGLSIGFRGLEAEQIKSSLSNGIRFKKWEWLELSTVTIPANASASIATVKQYDGASSSPNTAAPAPLARNPAAPQSTHEGKSQMNSVQRAEAERAGKMQAANALREKVEAQGLTLDADQQKEFDGLMNDVESIDAHITRLKRFESLATPPSSVPPTGAVSLNSPGLQPQARVQFQKSNDPAGITVARIARCAFMAKGSPHVAAQIAAEIYRDDPRVAQHFKATVVAGSTISGTWGADLMTTDGGPFAEFLEYLRPLTIIGRIPGITRVPFYAPVGIQTGAGAGYWVGEGKGKPLTSFDYDKQSLAPLTVANIVVLTKKLFKYSGVNADAHIRDQMAQALVGRMDTDFIDPAKAVSAGVSPASITNGLTAPNSAGNTADDVREDIKTLLSALARPIRGLVFITDTPTAIALSLMVNGLGQPEFPGVSMSGGTLAGAPLVVSDSVPAVTAGSLLIAVKAPEILLADEGGFNIDLSEDATIEMSDAPAGSSVATVAASGTLPVSMFQTNGVAFRVERDLNWAVARSGAVALIDTVNYGEA
jgi:HK97 family phage prohead protease